MTSIAAEPHPDDDARAAETVPPPPAAQLWIRAGGWLVRADQVVAVGYDTHEHARGTAKHVVEIATAGSRGGDGDVAPATYTVARVEDEDQARRLADEIVQRMAGWRHRYGILSVTSKGSVRTSRPRPGGTSDAVGSSGDARRGTEPGT
ncbi:hypothetical protein L3Q65_00640 (plasmid) [Amycolatopsis sp. FU40]|uniref:hypothetical protein n=1 Tax=Amycolatopsis sp. FU40 TaxID=2914159 RepID=UPI001F32B89C|nr:hypothetical protein [Amycolatopsis sp. FU40]UKD50836.1 hypothetical protein L3Q65_00640 [Amycolatopsis sp. FU40]